VFEGRKGGKDSTEITFEIISRFAWWNDRRLGKMKNNPQPRGQDLTFGNGTEQVVNNEESACNLK
jgi:hypothetical protein